MCIDIESKFVQMNINFHKIYIFLILFQCKNNGNDTLHLFTFNLNESNLTVKNISNVKFLSGSFRNNFSCKNITIFICITQLDI